MAQKYNEYYLSWDEINKIIATAKNLKERLVLKLLARTGMRRFELKNIKISHLDLERKRIFIVKGKGGTQKNPKSRTVPIDDDTLGDIKVYTAGRRSGFLIQSNKKDLDGIALCSINRIVSNAAKKAEVKNPNPSIKNLNPHIFRHSFSRLSLAEGIPFNVVQKIVGHADARTTLQMYGVPSVNDAQSIYEDKLNEKFKKPLPKLNFEKHKTLDKFQNSEDEKEDKIPENFY